MIWYDMVLKQTKHIKSISLWISDHIKSEYWTISHIEPMKLSSMQSAFEYLPVPQTAKHRFWFVDWMWIQHQTQHQIMILLNLWTTRSYNFRLKTQKFQHDTHTHTRRTFHRIIWSFAPRFDGIHPPCSPGKPRLRWSLAGKNTARINGPAWQALTSSSRLTKQPAFWWGLPDERRIASAIPKYGGRRCQNFALALYVVQKGCAFLISRKHHSLWGHRQPSQSFASALCLTTFQGTAVSTSTRQALMRRPASMRWKLRAMNRPLKWEDKVLELVRARVAIHCHCHNCCCSVCKLIPQCSWQYEQLSALKFGLSFVYSCRQPHMCWLHAGYPSLLQTKSSLPLPCIAENSKYIGLSPAWFVCLTVRTEKQMMMDVLQLGCWLWNMLESSTLTAIVVRNYHPRNVALVGSIGLGHSELSL